jgi:hypothetical protein
MTPFVSTSGPDSGSDLLIQALSGTSMQGGIVGRSVLPATPHDPNPGPREDAGDTCSPTALGVVASIPGNSALSRPSSAEK